MPEFSLVSFTKGQMGIPVEGEGCGASALALPGGRYITDIIGESGTSDLGKVDGGRTRLGTHCDRLTTRGLRPY